MRSTRVLNDAIVNSMSRSSSSVRSRKASTPSLPCAWAMSATERPSSAFSAGDCTSCTVMRAQLPKPIGFFSSSRNWLRKAGSA